MNIPTDHRKPMCLAFAALLTGLFAASPLQAEDDLAKRLLEFTGAKRVKVICNGSIFGDKDGLWGYDTKTGKEQPLYDKSVGQFFYISRDGEVLAFSPNWTVGWDGKPPRQLPTDKGLSLSCLWTDPKTGHKWVYVCDHLCRDHYDPSGGGRDGSKLVRIRLDDPKIVEPIWKSEPFDASTPGWWDNPANIGICFSSLSYDGTKGVSWITGTKIGFWDFTAGEVRFAGVGCNLSMAPGNSYWFTHLEGNHTNLSLLDQELRKVSSIPINTMPPLNGRGKLFPVRWCNHPRFLMVGIESGGPSGAYLGRFNETFTEVEAWLQITDKSKPRTGVVWIDEETAAAGVAAFETGIVAARKTSAKQK